MTFKNDKTTSGWKLVSDIGDKKPKKLVAVSFLKEGESKITGEELLARSQKMNVLGQADAEYFLEHQKEIPEEYREFYLIFPGTVWRDPYGYFNVAYLEWGGGRWYLRFGWLVGGWGALGRLACSEVSDMQRILTPTERIERLYGDAKGTVFEEIGRILDNLSARLDAMSEQPVMRWHTTVSTWPSAGDTYFGINSRGDIFRRIVGKEGLSARDMKRIAFGNALRTKEEAEKVREEIQKILKKSIWK